jgi:hypothetical protein
MTTEGYIQLPVEVLSDIATAMRSTRTFMAAARERDDAAMAAAAVLVQKSFEQVEERLTAVIL